MPEAVSKTSTLTYPWVFHGACMHCVDPKHPERAFSKEPLAFGVQEDFPLHIGYSPACVKEYDLGGHGDIVYDCNCPWPHGHVLLLCDDGSAWVNAPIASGAMVEEIIKECNADPHFNFSAEDKAEMARMLRALTEHILPDEMTEEEKKFLSDLGGNRGTLRPMGWFC